MQENPLIIRVLHEDGSTGTESQEYEASSYHIDEPSRRLTIFAYKGSSSAVPIAVYNSWIAVEIDYPEEK